MMDFLLKMIEFLLNMMGLYPVGGEEGANGG